MTSPILSRAYAKALSVVKLVSKFSQINFTRIVKGEQTAQHSFTPVEYIEIKKLFTDQKYQRLINQNFINLD